MDAYGAPTIRNKAKWTSIAGRFSNGSINFTKCRSIQDGISVQPPTPYYYRAMKSFLDKNQEEYHTFLAPEEKPMKVVIRGIPVKITEADFNSYLSVSGFSVLAVLRMVGRGKQPIPLVMVTLKKTKEASSRPLSFATCGSLWKRQTRARPRRSASAIGANAFTMPDAPTM